MGLGEAKDNPKILDSLCERTHYDYRTKARHITTAKKSVANFKLREGSKIGCKVTLRDKRCMTS